MTGTAVASYFNFSSYTSYQTTSKRTETLSFSDIIDAKDEKAEKQ